MPLSPLFSGMNWMLSPQTGYQTSTFVTTSLSQNCTILLFGSQIPGGPLAWLWLHLLHPLPQTTHLVPVLLPKRLQPPGAPLPSQQGWMSQGLFLAACSWTIWQREAPTLKWKYYFVNKAEMRFITKQLLFQTVITYLFYFSVYQKKNVHRECSVHKCRFLMRRSVWHLNQTTETPCAGLKCVHSPPPAEVKVWETWCPLRMSWSHLSRYSLACNV